MSDPARDNLPPRRAGTPGRTARPARGGLARPGFTLLELVVAMAMVAVLAVSLYSTLRVAFRARSSAEAALVPSRSSEITMDFLRVDLENAAPPTGVLAGPFIGTDQQDDRGHDGDDLTFVSTAPASDRASANGDLKGVELTVEVPNGSSEHCLVRRVTRNLMAQVQQDPDEEILCRGVEAFNVRYYDGSEWLDAWDSTTADNTLPVAVEVTLTLDAPAGSGQDGRQFTFTRIFPLPCSTAATDPAANPGLGS